MADQTNFRCLMQKTFLSLLDNMAMNMNLKSGRQSEKNNLTFRQSSKHSSSDNRHLLAESPTRELLHDRNSDTSERLAKQHSPVRHFLDTGVNPNSSQEFSIKELDTKELDSIEPSQIMLSSMFDQRQSVTSLQGGNATQDNFLLLLKCLRNWKQYVRHNHSKKVDTRFIQTQIKQLKN